MFKQENFIIFDDRRLNNVGKCLDYIHEVIAIIAICDTRFYIYSIYQYCIGSA